MSFSSSAGYAHSSHADAGAVANPEAVAAEVEFPLLSYFGAL